MNLDVVEKAVRHLSDTLRIEGFKDRIEIILSKHDFTIFECNEELATRCNHWLFVPGLMRSTELKLGAVTIRERP